MLFIAAGLLMILISTVMNFSAVGYIFTLAAALFTFFNPKKGLILLFLYMPVEPFVSEYNSGMMAFADAVIFSALLKVFWQNRKDIKSLFHFHWFEYGYLGFIAAGVIAALLNGVPPVSIIFQIRAFILFYLIFYLVKRLKVTKEDLRLVIWSTVSIFLLLIVQGVVEKLSVRGLFLPDTWQAWPLSAVNRIRIYGMLGNPNVLSIYMSFAFILFIYLKNRFTGKTAWLFAILAVMAMGTIVLTYSRGTWIGFGLGLVLYIFLTKRYRIVIETAKYLAISGLLFILPLNLLTTYIESTEAGQQKVGSIQQYDEGGQSNFSDRIGNTFSDDTIRSSEEAGRMYIVKKGFEVFLDHPVIGTGFSTYGDSASLSRGSVIYEEYEVTHNFYSDNQYIQVIVQTGIIGVALFALFLLGMLKELYSRRKESRFYIYMAGVLIGSFFMGLVYNLWENDIFALIFFASMGLALNMHQPVKQLDIPEK